MWSTSKLDLYNMNGAPLCHGFGCRKHTKLTKRYNGLFCPGHLREMDEIRSKITHYKHIDTKTTEDIQSEMCYREQEFRLRKRMDSGHMHHHFKLTSDIDGS